MSKSDLILRFSLVALLGLGCSGGDEASPDAPPQTPNVPLTIEPLSDAELLGIPREQVLLTLPWSQQVVGREPAPAAARASVVDVEVVRGPGFDRAIFEVATGTDFPGYRVVWNDTAAARCGEKGSADPGGGATLLIRLEPATARAEGKDASPVRTSVRSGFPAVASARQLCDEADRLVWALAAADSTVFRVVELHTPPRLVVDVAHPGTNPAAGLRATPPPDGAAVTDSAAPAPR